MSNNTAKNNVVSAAALKALRQRAAAVAGEKTVINAAVTGRLTWLDNVDVAAVAAAGKTSLREKDGIIRNNYDLFFSGGMSGKMEGMPGLSGFAGNNPACLRRALLGFGICRHCFSFLTPWKPSILAWTKNDLILSSVMMQPGAVIIDPEKLPYMRYSSHGDLINDIHAYNYLRIAADNPETQFALWTKNAKIYRAGLQLFGAPKPNNMTVIYSQLFLNCRPAAAALEAAKASGFDAIFSVFDRVEAQREAVAGGAYGCKCGPRSCRHKCLFCYDQQRREGFGSPEKAILISEILDGDRHKE